MNTGRFQRDWNKLNQKQESQQAGQPVNADQRFYKPKFNKDGTFSAVVRFLPGPVKDGNEEISMIKKYSHYFSGPGGKYDEECLTTISQQCPVCDENKKCWDAGDKQTSRTRARVNSGITNILVINDPQAPENNGKVFLYKFGKKIIEKINEAKKPTNPTKKAIEVFSYYEGANFYITGKKTVTAEGQKFTDYTSSSFESNPSAIGDDNYIESIDKQLHSVEEFIKPTNFKSYAALQELFSRVMGRSMAQQPNPFQTPAPQAPAQNAFQAQMSQPAPTPAPVQNFAPPVQQNFAPQAPQQYAAPTPVQPQAPIPMTQPLEDVADMSEDEFFAR